MFFFLFMKVKFTFKDGQTIEGYSKHLIGEEVDYDVVENIIEGSSVGNYTDLNHEPIDDSEIDDIEYDDIHTVNFCDEFGKPID